MEDARRALGMLDLAEERHGTLPDILYARATIELEFSMSVRVTARPYIVWRKINASGSPKHRIVEKADHQKKNIIDTETGLMPSASSRINQNSCY